MKPQSILSNLIRYFKIRYWTRFCDIKEEDEAHQYFCDHPQEKPLENGEVVKKEGEYIWHKKK